MTHHFSNFTLESQRRDDLFTPQPDLSFLRTIADAGEISSIAQLEIKPNKVLITQFI